MRRTTAIAALVVAAVAYGAAQTPQPPPPGGGRQGAPPPGRGGGGMLAGAGPSDKPVVDAAAADRGRRTWAAECINCHGTQARGNDNGPNLVRSVIVLHDRYGSQIGPFLAKGHKLQSGASGATLSEAQVQELAHFLRQRVNDGLRGSPLFQPQNVLTGDPKAGEALLQGRRQVHHLSFDDRQPRWHRRAHGTDRSPAAIPVPRDGTRRARTRPGSARADGQSRPGHGDSAKRPARIGRADPDGRLLRVAQDRGWDAADLQARHGHESRQSRIPSPTTSSCSIASPTRTCTTSSLTWRH